MAPKFSQKRRGGRWGGAEACKLYSYAQLSPHFLLGLVTMWFQQASYGPTLFLAPLALFFHLFFSLFFFFSLLFWFLFCFWNVFPWNPGELGQCGLCNSAPGMGTHRWIHCISLPLFLFIHSLPNLPHPCPLTIVPSCCLLFLPLFPITNLSSPSFPPPPAVTDILRPTLPGILHSWNDWGGGEHYLTITFRADLDNDCFRDGIPLWEVGLVCLTPVWQRRTPHWSYNPLPHANPSTRHAEGRKILKTTKTLVNTLAVSPK